MDILATIVPVLPFFVALFLLGVEKKELIPKISLFGLLIVSIGGIILSADVIGSGVEIYAAGNLMLYGKIASILVVYVAVIGMVIVKYSTRYMWDEPGYKRFFILLNLIIGSILLLIASNNLILLAVAWQLMSVLLYFLVTFDSSNNGAIYYGKWTMFTHRLADLLFIVATVILIHHYGFYTINELTLHIKTLYKSGAEDNVIFVVALLYLFAAMMKSAIMPFHLWLPYTSSAPTPVSALMHAGIVNVGGILLNKLAFILLLAPGVLNIAFIFGLITAVVASLFMLATPDIKRMLGYSTAGQMGYMIMEIGIGAFSLAIYHLMVHGIFKASLFLESGSLIHHARHDPNIPKRLSHETFWEEKSENKDRSFWKLIAIATIVPIVLFIAAKALLSTEFFEFDAAVIILAFAWLTGTQMFFSFFKVSKAESLKIMLGLFVSFFVIVFTYEFLGHMLENYFYGEYAKEFYKVASLDSLILFAFVLFGAVFFIGWVIAYRKKYKVAFTHEHADSKRWFLYSFLAKEGYFPRMMQKIHHYFLK